MEEHDTPMNELEVQFRPEQGKAIIEGKTVIPFQSLVMLILQRKVIALFKQWGKEPVVVGSELLASLSIAPQDSQENRGHQIFVALGVGALAGVAVFAIIEVLLETAQIFLTRKDLLLIAGSIIGLGVIALLLMRMQRVKRGEKVVESIEKLSSFLSGK